MKRRVPQQKQRIEVRAGQQDARGVDAAFHRIARRELLQQGLQATVGRARMDVDQVVMVLDRAPAEAEDAVVVMAIVDADARAPGKQAVGFLPAPEKVDIDIARGPMPRHRIIERQPVALEHHDRQSRIVVERRQIPQRAAVGVVVLLRLHRERQPVELEVPERGVQRLRELRPPLVKR